MTSSWMDIIGPDHNKEWEEQVEQKQNLCDCEKSYNGFGMTGRICDCNANIYQDEEK